MIPFCFGGLCAEINIVYEIIAVLIAIFGVLTIWGTQRKE